MDEVTDSLLHDLNDVSSSILAVLTEYCDTPYGVGGLVIAINLSSCFRIMITAKLGCVSFNLVLLRKEALRSS
jgi:hypothetical protein